MDINASIGVLLFPLTFENRVSTRSLIVCAYQFNRWFQYWLVIYWGQFYHNDSAWSQAWISNRKPVKCWVKLLTHPQTWTVQWISNLLSLYNGWNYSSMLGLKLIHVSESGNDSLRQKGDILNPKTIIAIGDQDLFPRSVSKAEIIKYKNSKNMRSFSFSKTLFLFAKQHYLWVLNVCPKYASYLFSRSTTPCNILDDNKLIPLLKPTQLLELKPL